jgi:ATP-dependent Lon protease
MVEKLAIARQFLVPKQLEANGLGGKAIGFEDETLRTLIEGYTREAGVRNLEREVGAICRKLARRLVQDGTLVKVAPGAPPEDEIREPDSAAAGPPLPAGEGRGAGSAAATPPVSVTPEMVAEFLGRPRFRPRRKNETSEVGVATGLAWTEVGGELLETEIGLMKGKGKLTLTGKLGEVMQESARAAVSYTRSRAYLLGVDPDFNEGLDVHIHVPEGAIPKDGPSAGITMATALVSALTKIPVRKDLAMTGEVTLRGKVLPVGGIKDKLLAAFRAGITEIILPRENEKDLEEVPADVRGAMEVRLVDSMDEVLRLALDGYVPPLPEAGPSFTPAATEPASGEAGPIAH